MTKELHSAISAVLTSPDVAPCQFIWDEACGGDQRIPLYPDASKARGAVYTCVDGVLIHDSQVLLILEIEEEHTSGFAPHRITGKVYTAGLCRFYIPGEPRARAIELADDVQFIQIVNTAGLKPRSRKPRQYERLAESIKASLPFGRIRTYNLLAGETADFRDGERGEELRQIVSAAVADLLTVSTV